MNYINASRTLNTSTLISMAFIVLSLEVIIMLLLVYYRVKKYNEEQRKKLEKKRKNKGN